MRHLLKESMAVYILLLITVLAAFPNIIQAAVEKPEIEFRNEILIGSETGYPPYAIVNEHGEADGFSVDLIKAVCKAMGLKTKFKIGPWSEVRSDLENGVVDALPLVGYTKQRDRLFDFSEPHLVAFGGVFVRDGSPIPDTLDEISKKPILTMASDNTHDYLLKNNIGSKLLAKPKISDVLKALASGEADYAVLPRLVGLIKAKELELDNIQLSQIRITAYGPGYGFAVHEGDAVLLALLNQGLALIKADGTYDQIYQKWFGIIDQHEHSILESEIIRYAVITIGIILVILLLVFSWTLTLRKAVHTKTAELLESEEKFRLLAQVSPVGVFVSDVDGNTIYWNDMLCDITGMSASEGQGEGWADGIHPDDKQRVFDQWYESIETRNNFKAEYRFIDREGHVTWTIGQASALYNSQEELIGSVGSITDITELKQAHEQIASTEKKLATLISSVPGATYQCKNDDDWTITFISDEIENISGYPASDFTNGKRTYASIIHPEDVHLVNTAVQKGVENGKPYSIEYRIINAAGNKIWVMERGQSITGEGGEPSLLEGVVVNDNQRKMMELELAESMKMAALGTLVGGVAHEFNNTLAGMTGNLFLAKRGASELPQVVQKLDIVEKLSFKAGGMIQQLLAFAHKGIIERKNICLTECVSETIKLQEASIPANIIFLKQLTDKKLLLLGDYTLLQQVIMNLLNNARDAVNSCSSPKITISLDETLTDDVFYKKHPVLKDMGKIADLCVSDNGCGIAEKNISQIFDPFFTTKEVGQGTGLGLSMLQGTVHSHQGAIEVNSKVGIGTEFHIYFPLINSDEDINRDSNATEIIEGNGETILIADDNKAFIDAHRDVLENIGYKVHVAHNGLEATKYYMQHNEEIELVILDVMMPVMGGVEAAREIRLMDNDAKIIFATAYDKTDALRKIEELDAETVISKPFEIIEISHLIREQLNS